jgi:hypothetical protein
MTSVWKRAWISAEIAARVATPVTHPALESTHLEPTMTDTQISQEIQRDEDAAAGDEMEHEREARTAASATPNRAYEIRHSAVASLSPQPAADRTQSQRKAPQPQPRSEIAASHPTRTRHRTR